MYRDGKVMAQYTAIEAAVKIQRLDIRRHHITVRAPKICCVSGRKGD